MDKKFLLLIVVAILIIALGVGGYFYWTKVLKKSLTPEGAALENAGEAANTLNESVTQGVLPSIGQTNPLQNAPDVNPVDTSNPFRNVKTNPFQ